MILHNRCTTSGEGNVKRYCTVQVAKHLCDGAVNTILCNYIGKGGYLRSISTTQNIVTMTVEFKNKS